ncbi:MAG: VCBS repeat-containing protein [Acidobacteriota bacterium]
MLLAFRHLGFAIVWGWILLVAPGLVLGSEIIRHQGFDHFIKGSFEDGGARDYVSKSGTIELIHRWDLNNDGQLDLVMAQDHNQIENVDAFIYWGTSKGYRSLFPSFWKQVPAFKLVRAIGLGQESLTMLPTFGGGHVKIADLDRDGYLDIVFPNTIHNHTVHMPAYVYWGGPEGYSLRHRTELPTLFALDIAVADLNRDGYPDLVLANFGYESGDRWGYKDNLESYIYWGNPEGFSIKRRASISTRSAVSCATGDFNGDGWPDLAFANNDLQHRSVAVYLGGKDGYSALPNLRVEGGNPGVVRAGNLNKDGADDLMIGSREKGTAIYWGSADFALDNPVKLPAEDTKDIVSADLNGDGYPDLVLASRSLDTKRPETESIVYWGTQSGFEASKRSLLPTMWPNAVTIRDLNHDTYPDVVFANSHNGDTYDVPSYVYWGASGGIEASRRTDLQGFGAVGVASEDLNHDGTPEIVLMNQLSGAVQGHTPSVIFWGNPAHEYSEAASTLMRASGPYFTKTADLNNDGFTDVVFTGSPCIIHWGSASGFVKRTQIDLTAFGGVVADYNRDGYLDLIFSTWSNDPRINNNGVVLWGGTDGYSLKNSTKVPLKVATRTTGVASADLNRDGYVDLIFPMGESPSRSSEIVWGGPHGFGQVSSTVLHTNMVDSPTVADLDGNGWLDVIFPGGQDYDTQNPHTKSLIYWGSEKGYSDTHRSEFEGYMSAEIEVEDLNRDGYLDVVASNYKAENTRHLPVFIYWGNARHQYSSEHRTELPAESSCGIQLLDLNQDGFSDIVVHNHIKEGDHTFGSFIYWGSKDGYSIDRRAHVPTMGTHYAHGISPGNIYDRRPHFGYVSPSITLAQGWRELILDWKGETPHKTTIRVEVRAASKEAELRSITWTSITRGKAWRLPAGSTCAQYRVVLHSPDGANSPTLQEVILELK